MVGGGGEAAGSETRCAKGGSSGRRNSMVGARWQWRRAGEEGAWREYEKE